MARPRARAHRVHMNGSVVYEPNCGGNLQNQKTVVAAPGAPTVIGHNTLRAHTKRGRSVMYEVEAVSENNSLVYPNYVGEQVEDERIARFLPGSMWKFTCGSNVLTSPDQRISVIGCRDPIQGNVDVLAPGMLAVMLSWMERWERVLYNTRSWGSAQQSRLMHCDRPMFLVNGRPCLIVNTNLLTPM